MGFNAIAAEGPKGRRRGRRSSGQASLVAGETPPHCTCCSCICTWNIFSASAICFSIPFFSSSARSFFACFLESFSCGTSPAPSPQSARVNTPHHLLLREAALVMQRPPQRVQRPPAAAPPAPPRAACPRRRPWARVLPPYPSAMRRSTWQHARAHLEHSLLFREALLQLPSLALHEIRHAGLLRHQHRLLRLPLRLHRGPDLLARCQIFCRYRFAAAGFNSKSNFGLGFHKTSQHLCLPILSNPYNQQYNLAINHNPMLIH